jgi:hypothetical protein
VREIVEDFVPQWPFSPHTALLAFLTRVFYIPAILITITRALVVVNINDDDDPAGCFARISVPTRCLVSSTLKARKAQHNSLIKT